MSNDMNRQHDPTHVRHHGSFYKAGDMIPTRSSRAPACVAASAGPLMLTAPLQLTALPPPATPYCAKAGS